MTNYDVIILGAGSVGTTAALSMAQAGLKVLVIDPMPSAGQGSNKAAIGGIRATHSDPAKIRLCLRSLEIFSTWEERYGDDIEWLKGGYAYPVYRQHEEQLLKDLLVTQKSYGLHIDWCDRERMLEVIPDLNPDGLIGGTFAPDDGSASPMLSAHAFWKQACLQGVEFRFQEMPTAVIVEGGRVKGVRTNKGQYGASFVVNAAGAWAADVARLIGGDVPVKPDLHEAAITEPVAPFLAPMVVDIRPAPGSANYYFYQHKTGQVIFCITPSPQIWGMDRNETSSFLPMVAKRMVDLMPRLAGIRVRRTWRGMYPMTPDGSPIVGWAREAEGFVHAVGMCGQGYMLGPGVGELLARMVQGTVTEADREVLTILSPERTYAGMERLK
ncbi:MAG TPA: FAD-binding oxidoreductase [Symbiobacteriaceae bacterium]|nr:FAD-binding oxidoreductase [Symbiobacteriaceae bacterium]